MVTLRFAAVEAVTGVIARSPFAVFATASPDWVNDLCRATSCPKKVLEGPDFETLPALRQLGVERLAGTSLGAPASRLCSGS